MSWLLFILILPLLLPTFVLMTEVVLGMWPCERTLQIPPFSGHAVIVVPAHNEAAGLGKVIEAIAADCRGNYSILVVADNCTDETSAVAIAAGAQVVERLDSEKRGKGFALAFGRAHLSKITPPDVVVVIDADTSPRSGSLEMLVSSAAARDTPIQASYLFLSTAGDTSIVKFSAIGILIKNFVRQLGALRLGGPAILTGSGMAFPWKQFAELPLDSGHLAEDLMLGVSSTLKDKPPVFLPGALVTGATSSEKGTLTQRRRWESGFFDMMGSAAVPLLKAAITRRKPYLLWSALNLATPPFVPLMTANLIALTALGFFAFFGIATPVFVLLLSMVTVVMMATILAVILTGHRDLLSGWQGLPRYVYWKLRLSVGVISRRERRWIRTERD